MNLHGIVAGVISAVNPFVPVTVKVSTGDTDDVAGKRTPSYATPGAITASIAGDVMTVSAVASGKLYAGQTIAGAGVVAGTSILRQISGISGGAGTYQVSEAQTVASVGMTTTLVVTAQIQALSFRDIAQMDGMNIQGTRRAIYFYGRIEGLVRPESRGGDLVYFPDGTVWLVAIVLETWPDWCKVAATLQNSE